MVQPRPVCPFEGCGKPLSPRNSSAVCVDHLHKAPHCQCLKCRSADAPMVMTERGIPAGRKVVQIPEHATYSGIFTYAQITMPMAPWE